MGERHCRKQASLSGDSTPAVGTHPGRVLLAAGGVYRTELDGGGVVEAALRGRLKQDERSGDRVVAGDRVTVAVDADGSATIEAVAERSSALVRRSPGHGRRPKPIVANVDRVLIVFAYTRPEPRLRLLDRFLVLAGSSDLPAVIIANKVDLSHDDDDPFALYEHVGYEVVRTSIESGAGLARLRELLAGATSVLTGPSGVGKSSLLNALEPRLDLRVGAVSEAVRKGQHTTVSARLIPLAGGYVADTPGLRELGLWDVDPENVDREFIELEPLVDRCRFGHSCRHEHEPDCAVRAALEAGDIARERYDSYLTLRHELEQAARRY